MCVTETEYFDRHQIGAGMARCERCKDELYRVLFWKCEQCRGTTIPLALWE
ncbi:MAG: hypothetical protein WCI87_07980 [Euryarchaeota archaeon]